MSMHIASLTLHNYRNYADEVFEFDPCLTLIVAPNAHGKTNMLEALHFASTGKGVYEHTKEELVRFGEANMHVELIFQDENEHRTSFKAGIAQQESGSTKHFMVHGTRKGMYSYTQLTPPVVLFSPSFMNIIEGSPTKRRDFVDIILCRIDLAYKKHLHNYENGLRKRNRILESERNPTKLREALHFWNDFLIEHATYITQKRQWLADYMNTQTMPTMTRSFKLVYSPKEMTLASLEESFEKQFYQKRTLVGPQRDDFRIDLLKNDAWISVHAFASRGEQRLALLWLILHQLDLYEHHVSLAPILLLDDILSELDETNKKLIQTLVTRYQTILTSAEPIPEDVLKAHKTILLKASS